MRSLIDFIVPVQRGEVKKLEDLFPGKTVKVSNAFREYFGLVFATRILHCSVHSTDVGPKFIDRVNVELFGRKVIVSGTNICSILHYLWNIAPSIIEIPEGMKAVAVILGYGYVNGVWHVFFLLHKRKGESEEIHLDALPLDQWDEDEGVFILTLVVEREERPIQRDIIVAEISEEANQGNPSC